ncbi:MAG: hypothetical protein AAGA92_02120 [Planctomycetota bacterium]
MKQSKHRSPFLDQALVVDAPEQRVLRTFRQYLMTPGKMLCFSGPDLAKKKAVLEQMCERELLWREEFAGAYSLTPTGFSAMKSLK